jgi:hypothetical protein
MASSGDHDSDQPPGTGVPGGGSTWRVSLDALAVWCADVLQRAVDADLPDGETAVISQPPLPWHLRDPLRRHGFDGFDETAIALTLAPDLDPVLGVAMSELTGVRSSRYATIAVIADLVGAEGPERVEVASRLSAGGPLAELGLLHIVPPEDAPLVGQPQRGPSLLDSTAASTALLRWTFGITQLDPSLFPLVRDDLIAPSTPPDAVAAELLSARILSSGPQLTSLTSARQSDAVATALFAASRVRHPVLVVDAAALVDPDSATRVAAEALLRTAVAVVVGDVLAVPPQRWEAFANVITIGEHPQVVAGSVHDVALLTVHPNPAVSVGTHLVDLLRERGLTVPDTEAERIARWGHLRHEDLQRIVGVIGARVAGRPGDADAVTARAVADVTVGDAGDDLARLATPIETIRDWNQLVLPRRLLGELHDLVDQAEQRQFVLAESGFAERPGQPRGVTAVFAGPSGTGKTLAARVVAGELGLPLYAINLAATVSKYIGETSRNLERIFSAAERTDAVLLFDEAEALFGKRSEVQDARDRYANIEVAYLLQRMERYDGVAILATNLLSHFDDAFARRLSFCLYFPYPDAADRRRIWDAAFPAQVALSGDLDLEEVSEMHPLSGGHIRNVAVAATSIARSRGTSVDRASLLKAIDREYAKFGQVPDTVVEAAQ